MKWGKLLTSHCGCSWDIYSEVNLFKRNNHSFIERGNLFWWTVDISKNTVLNLKLKTYVKSGKLSTRKGCYNFYVIKMSLKHILITINIFILKN